MLTCLMIGVVLGTSITNWYNGKNPDAPIIITQPIDITPELEQIDSLNLVVVLQEDRIKELEKELENNRVIVVKEIERIKELPANENLELMKDNLLAYGELTEESDTLLPQLIQVPEEDGIRVTISENNLKDVNIISAKYQGEVQANENLREQLNTNSIIISAKDSIISRSNIIIAKNEESYEINLKSLQSGLEKERKEKIKRTAILGTSTAALAILTGALVFKK